MPPRGDRRLRHRDPVRHRHPDDPLRLRRPGHPRTTGGRPVHRGPRRPRRLLGPHIGTLNWGEDAGRRASSRSTTRPSTSRVAKAHHDEAVINVGRFTDPDVMVEAITSGQCDIIGAARPSIADPFLPEKIEEGRFDGHPRVHRLQPVRLQLGVGRPADLVHPERHRRRGVPPRLAPRAVRHRRERREARSCRRRRTGRHGVRRRAGQARLRRPSTSSTPSPHGRAPQLDDDDARAAPLAQRHASTASARSRSSTTSSSSPTPASTRKRSATTARRSSSWRRDRTGAETA